MNPFVRLLLIFLQIAAFVFTAPIQAADISQGLPSPQDIIIRMDQAWSQVSAYRMQVEQMVYAGNTEPDITRATYTFKKPDHIRIEMQQPYHGMVLVFPDRNGKVEVKPGGIAGFFVLHLSPDNHLITSRLGQPIDKTSLGLLIHNIALSLTEERQGPVSIWEENGRLEVQVLAENHFDNRRSTLYTFGIDESLWLPVSVVERSINGQLRRVTTFNDLKIDIFAAS